MIGWEDYYSRGIFLVKGFPHYKDQIEELFIVMVYCMHFQHITLSTFSLISLFKLQHTCIEGTIMHSCAESAVKPRSVSQSTRGQDLSSFIM